MRDQLTQYVNLIFAGSSGAEEIKTEILQNTLDRYDDLTAQGCSPEEAYRIAISGIGDVNELLTGQTSEASSAYGTRPTYAPDPGYENSTALVTRIIRAAAICMYIASPAPILILEPFGLDDFGVALMLLIIAAATALLLIFRKKKPEEEEPAAPTHHTQAWKKMKKSTDSLISTLGLIFYVLISFITGMWAITWLVFPIVAAIKKVVHAYMDLKENT